MRLQPLLVVCMLALPACGRSPSPQLAPPGTGAADGADPVAGTMARLPAGATGVDADPVVGRIDGIELHLSHVRDRLAQLPATLTPTDASLQAVALAAQDLLAVREMLVVKAEPRAGERPWQAADRFAADVWKGEPTCEADPGEVKLLYLQELKRYKHPAKFAIWDAQLQCCPDPGDCPPEFLRSCRQASEPLMRRLHAALATRWASLPPLGLAADATDVTVDASPVRGAHTDAFEQAVAALAGEDPHLQLRRYDFYRQGEPGFPASHFRPGEPSLATWAESARLGAISPLTPTVWGWSIALLAARQPTRSGKADPVVLAQLRAAACQQMAIRQRQEWRDRLFQGALLRWNREVVDAQFGPEVYRRLPRNQTPFGAR